MNDALCQSRWWFTCIVLVLLIVPLGGQERAGAVKVVIKDGKQVAPEAAIDPTQRTRIGYGGGMMYGIRIDGTPITCTENISVMPMARVDGQILQPGFDPMTGQASQPQPLPPGPFGKKRIGTQIQWKFNDLRFTQVVETIPSQLRSTATAQDKRRLDNVRASLLIENKGIRPHTVDYRVFIDTMIADNDGALFAAPTAPGAVLDGMVLEGKLLPEYLQVLERPNLDKPGFVGTMTLRFTGKVEGPNKVILSNTAALNGQWDAPVLKANGDSAALLYWPQRALKPGEKRTLVWAYGGGIASPTDNDDNVAIAFGGSLVPGKLFTVTATVDDPLPGQSLTLELPPGMQRVEGAERQPVPGAQGRGMSAVLWKARVERLGSYELKVRSSTGVTHVKNITIAPAR